MAKLNVIDMNGKSLEEITLNKDIFAIEYSEHAVYQAVRLYRASLRQGTHAVKNRSAVRGGGRKPWKQKGTGNARQGTIRAPHWVGGGVVFGPQPRSYTFKLNKKIRRLALKSALSKKLEEKNIIILSDLKFKEIKTKNFISFLGNINVERKVLIADGELNENTVLSSRNLQDVNLVTASNLNVYDILNANKLILTVSAIKKIEEILG